MNRSTFATILDMGVIGEQAVTVSYGYSKGRAGTCFEPPEYPEAELLAVIWNGNDLLEYLSDYERDIIICDISCYAAEENACAEESRAEQRRDEMREARCA